MSLFFGDYNFSLFYILLIILTKIIAYFNSSFKYTVKNYVGKMTIGLVILAIFSSLGYLIPKINPILYDTQLLNIDIKIFGTNLVLWVSENIKNRILIEWFQINYLLYFFFVFGIILYMIINKKNENNIEFVIFSITFSYLISYTGYIIFPALGPRDPSEEIELAKKLIVIYSNKIEGIFFTPYIRELLNTLEKIKVNAFPSGHTMLTLVALSHYKKYANKLFYFLLPIGISIILATIICRYHYGIDVIAGIFCFIIVKITEKKIFNLMLKLKKLINQIA